MKFCCHKTYYFVGALFLAITAVVLSVYWLLPPKTEPFINTSQAGQVKVAPKIEATLKLLQVGDIMLDRHIETLIARHGLDSLLGQLKTANFFENYDFIGGNLEGPATNQGAYYSPVKEIDFAFKPDNVGALKNYGFNFFGLANNHFYDQGERGIKESRENLSKLGFEFAGVKEGALDDGSVVFLEKNGLKIGFLSLSLTYAKVNEQTLKNLIKKAKAESDWLLVSVHWGQEYQHQANQEQQRLAYLMIDEGADLVVGHHPHVIQNMESYKGRLIFYSLGNFLFDQYFSADTQEGLALSLVFSPSRLDGHLVALKSKTSVLRLATTKESDTMVKTYNLKPTFSLEK